MFNLASINIQSDYQRQEYQQAVNHRRLVRAAKEAARSRRKRRLSINLNMFSNRAKEEEQRYGGGERRQALNSR